MKHILAAALLVSTSLWGAEAQVRLIDTIAVQVPDVTLGEIAQIQCDNPDLKQQLMDLVIADAPRIGVPRLITSYKVNNILKARGLDSKVDVLGKQTTVSTEARLVQDEEMMELIREWVLAQVDDQVRAEVDFFKLPINWEIPAGEDIRLIVDSRRTQIGGETVINLRAMAGDQVLASARSRVHVCLYKDMPVLTQPIQRGEVLDPSCYEVRETEITNQTGYEVSKIDDLLGMAAKRNLKSGQMLTSRDFDLPVLIERGEQVRIIVQNGAVKMSITGAEAMQSGKKGDVILFKNPLNQRQPLKAEVVRDGLALIALQ